MRRALHALQCMQSCTDPALYAGLYRPYTICRAVQALCRNCTIRSALQALSYT